MSDDDFPEILLSDDSVFKKSSLYPSVMNQYLEAKSNGELSKSGQSASHMRVQDARASLSSSPAVSEASHCSSLLRSTDDESISDAAWKEGLLPIPPPRKNAPANLQLNQSFLHGSLERKQGTSSLSESSGVSSAASTSPTGTVDNTQNDPNLYTSTAVVTLAGQKSPTQGARTSTSSMTAELRRQFFELPPPPHSSGTPPLSRGSASGDSIRCPESVKDCNYCVGITCTETPPCLRAACSESGEVECKEDSECFSQSLGNLYDCMLQICLALMVHTRKFSCFLLLYFEFLISILL